MAIVKKENRENKEKNYITPKGLSVLQAELQHLLNVERPEMTTTVAWARSLGKCRLYLWQEAAQRN